MEDESSEQSEHNNASVDLDLTEWKELFRRISIFLTDCERNTEFVTYEKAEYICERLENIIATVRRVCDYI